MTLHWRPDAAGSADAFTDVDWCDPGGGVTLVADSFRVAGGHARGLALHRERFLDGSRAQLGSHAVARVAAFVDDAVATIRHTANAHPDTPLFPRIELRARGDARLLLRPSPPLTTSVTLATATSDPRTIPTVKGPDLERLGALRTAAQAAGADEAVILDARGRVIEGAYSALLWSRENRLHVIAEAAARIPSVTERLVLDAARASGRAVSAAQPTLDALDGAAVWVLSALHGARAVTSWVDGPSVAADVATDAWLRAALDAALSPV